MLRIIVSTAVLVFLTASSKAEILPSFHLSHAAKAAANIVVVEDGKIVEVWVGEMKLGDDFAARSKPGSINVEYGFAGLSDVEIDQDLATKGLKRVAAVTGKRRVHFVAPAPQKTWEQEHLASYPAYSTVWIEESQAYAIQQWINPGPAQMSSLDMTEAALKQAILDIRAIDAQVQTASQEPDRTKRAAALLALLKPGARLANDEVEDAIRECGRQAWPALEAVLFQDEHLPLHGELIYLAYGIAKSDLPAAAAKIVAAERAYFEKLDAARKPYDRKALPHLHHEQRRSAAQWVIDSK